MAAKKKETKSKEAKETKEKKETKVKKTEKKIALTFLPIIGAADQFTMLLRKKDIKKDYGVDVAAYEPAIEGLPMKLTVKKGEILEVTKAQLEELQKMGFVETDEEYKQREKFIENLSAQHPETLTWEMIVSEGANFATLRDSQDIIYNDKLIRA
jgi:hypothetical protein